MKLVAFLTIHFGRVRAFKIRLLHSRDSRSAIDTIDWLISSWQNPLEILENASGIEGHIARV